MGLAFQERARAGFLALARDWPDRVRVVDGAGDAAQVAEAVAALVLALV